MAGTPGPSKVDKGRWRHWGGRLRHRWRTGGVRRVLHHGGELELLNRSMGFAALALVTLMPLLIVVAAAAPISERGFGAWLTDGMGIADTPANAVQRIFTAPRRVLSATSVFSVAALAVFGLSFASSVQTGYEKVWRLKPGRWHKIWRQAVWLVALTAYLFVEVESRTVLQHGWKQAVIRIGMTFLSGMLFFWWAQHFLLGERVSWRALLPGAIATMLGLVGLRAFSALVFSPLIISNAVTYGAVGTVLVVQSWLIGVGYVVFGGALLGHHIYERNLSFRGVLSKLRRGGR